MNIDDQPSNRSMPLFIWAILLGAVGLLMAWIFGIPGVAPSIR